MKVTDYRSVNGKELLVCFATGERDLYPVPYLQLCCRCARCVDELTGKQLIQEEHIDPNAEIREIAPVGSYALRFKWTSGCTSGIYSFDYLYEIRPAKIKKHLKD